MHEVRFREGEVIFSEGDIGEHCYKVLSGRVDIVVKVPGVMRRGKTEKIASCGPGEFIGEMSLIVGGPRSATAVTSEPTLCRAYSSAEILDLLQGDPQEALAYMRLMILRLQRSNRQISWVAGRTAPGRGSGAAMSL